jgi:phosphopantetheine adenylyltransferase
MTSDYLFAATTIQSSEQIMIGYTIASSFQLQLPAGRNNASSVYVIVHIRDMLGGVTEFSLDPIIVTLDTASVTMLINVLQQSNENIINSNPTIQLISPENPNTVAQVSISLFQVLNEMNIENLETAISSKY